MPPYRRGGTGIYGSTVTAIRKLTAGARKNGYDPFWLCREDETLRRARQYVDFLVFAHDAPPIVARGEPLADRVAVQSGLREASWMQAEEQTRTVPRQHLGGAFQHVQFRPFDVDLDEGRDQPQLADFVVERHNANRQFGETLVGQQAVDALGQAGFVEKRCDAGAAAAADGPHPHLVAGAVPSQVPQQILTRQFARLVGN